MEFSLCVTVSMSKCPCSIRTQTCWIRVHPNDLTLTRSSTKRKPCFAIRSPLQALAVRTWGWCWGHNSTHNSVCFSGVVSWHSPSCSSHTGLPTVPITGRWCLLRDIIVLSVLHAEKILLPTTITFSFRSQISQSLALTPVAEACLSTALLLAEWFLQTPYHCLKPLVLLCVHVPLLSPVETPRAQGCCLPSWRCIPSSENGANYVAGAQ